MEQVTQPEIVNPCPNNPLPSQEKKIILIMGIRGTGKSTKVKEILSERKRVFIYDTLGEYTSGVIIQDLATLSDVWLKVYDKNFKIIYQPINPVEDFSLICDLVFECGDMTFCIEEIDTFVPNNPQGLDFNFCNIVQRGRHKNIELIGITQRPYTIPPLLRSQCKRLISFRQFEQRDIDWIAAMIGGKAEEISDLKPFEYLEFDNGNINKGKTRKI